MQKFKHYGSYSFETNRFLNRVKKNRKQKLGLNSYNYFFFKNLLNLVDRLSSGFIGQLQHQLQTTLKVKVEICGIS